MWKLQGCSKVFTVCKTHQKFIRSNTVNLIPKEDREIIEDCHEPIVTKEEWLRVQKIIDARPDVGVGKDCPYYRICREASRADKTETSSWGTALNWSRVDRVSVRLFT